MFDNSTEIVQSGKHPAISTIAREHVENAAQLWLRYRDLREALPEQDAAVRHLWRRLSANLYGAVLSGDTGWDCALSQATDFPEAGEFFVLTWLALATSDRKRLSMIFDMVSATPEAIEGVRGGVTLAPARWLTPFVHEWLNASSWPARASALAACLRHGQDLGPQLAGFLRDRHAEVRIEAVRFLAGTTVDISQPLASLKADPDRRVRFEAALMLIRRGHRKDALAFLRELAEDPETPTALIHQSLDRAATLAQDEEIRVWVRAMIATGLDAHAIRVIGVHGDAASWPWLIDRMENGSTAECAGLAACDMLGRELTTDALFTDDPARLSEEIAAEYDLGVSILPDAGQFRSALADKRLTPVAGEERSLRAQTLDRYRAMARGLPA